MALVSFIWIWMDGRQSLAPIRRHSPTFRIRLAIFLNQI